MLLQVFSKEIKESPGLVWSLQTKKGVAVLTTQLCEDLLRIYYVPGTVRGAGVVPEVN